MVVVSAALSFSRFSAPINRITSLQPRHRRPAQPHSEGMTRAGEQARAAAADRADTRLAAFSQLLMDCSDLSERFPDRAADHQPVLSSALPAVRPAVSACSGHTRHALQDTMAYEVGPN